MNILKSILAWFLGLFVAKQAIAQKSPQQSLGGRLNPIKELDGYVNTISLHPELVKNLKIDHQHLLGLFTAVLGNAKNQKYEPIVEQLKKFKNEFWSHLSAENIKLYGYLEQQLEPNTPESNEMRQFRREMNSIERSVYKFLDKWIDDGVDNSTYLVFLSESEKIANALVQRIENEEQKLYPIYEKKIEEFLNPA